MRVEGLMFGAIAVFLAIMSGIYWVLAKEPAGTTCILLSAGLCAIIGYYSLFQSKHIGARPEDELLAEPSDGFGTVGHFSPGSYFPAAIALSATTIMLGIIFGIWLSFIGLFFVLVAIGGLLFEHYVGVKAEVAELVESGEVTAGAPGH